MNLAIKIGIPTGIFGIAFLVMLLTGKKEDKIEEDPIVANARKAGLASAEARRKKKAEMEAKKAEISAT